MAYANGRIPSSALAPIPGSSPRTGGKPLLRKDAARAYAALDNYARQKWGIAMSLSEDSIRRSYREYSAQVAARAMWCRQGRCGNAAIPGTSNHGLGINVDLMTRQQRWVMDQVGASFGFSKRWSDAPWEWWHITYRVGNYPLVSKYAVGAGDPTLRVGRKGHDVLKLKQLLYARGIRDFSKTSAGQPSSNRYDGFYGENTKRAVARFQHKRGLTADGVCGPSTWRELRRK